MPPQSSLTFHALGRTVQLTAEVLDQNNSLIADAQLTWSSSDSLIASVSGQGLVTAVGNGETRVSATYQGIMAEVGVTVLAPSPDRQVLVALYNQMNGPDWSESSNWLSDSPLNEWAGVTVDSRGNVTGLHLSQNNLKGRIPSELAQLSHLEVLDLSSNEIEGPIPPVLGNLAKLADFLLFSNQLTGSIPAELGRLSNLAFLALSDNRLSGTIPPELGQLPQLGILLLDDNAGLSGPLPSTFLYQRGLQLVAENTSLCAPLDAEFHSWVVPTCESTSRDFGVLVVMYDEMDGDNWSKRQNWLTDAPLDEWYGIKTDVDGQVRSVSLADNGVSGVIPYQIGQLARLESLDLSGNRLTGTVPSELDQLSALVRLHLHGNFDLTGMLPLSFIELQNLEYLTMHGTRVCAPMGNAIQSIQSWLQGMTQARIASCSALRSERIALDALYDRTGGWSTWTMNGGWQSYEHVGSWYGVTTNEDGYVTGLRLAANDLRGGIPSEINLLEHLVHLDLSDNPYLGGSPPIELTDLDLDTLLLTGTQLCFSENDDFQEWLSTIENTRYETCGVIHPHPDVEALTTFFYATNGPLWRSQSNWLSHSPLETWFGIVLDEDGRVTEIDLPANGLIGELPPEIGQLRKLETLDLSRNELSGAIPGEIGRLQSLRFLLLGKNELTGTVPAEFGQLSSLEVLRLEDNDLEGGIPDEIGQIVNLSYLFLGSNPLSGPIPRSIGQLENLFFMDISTALLTGPIPGELWGLAKLERLRLAGNRLSGPVSSEVARLTSLKEFDIRHNMDMSGRLPHQITSLNITTLLTQGTSICIPADAEFQAWLQEIPVTVLSDPCPL